MAGVNKIFKQVQKMQKKMELAQSGLAQKEIEVSSGGGAVTVRISGQQEIKMIRFDADFLKEDKAIVEETLMMTIKEAVAKSKALSESELGSITSGFNIPGLGL
ncbi:MAG: YbaB/EbfC family nucleoid-associated protein [Verrucomicrobiota bacterium]|nr:YbaB/EbfC family nucleoid-associated protein [Verrucomicrobiota bacterium]